MWDSKTNFDYLGVVVGKTEELLYSTCANFNIPQKGVVLFFDKFNYTNYRKTIWRDLGSHLNIELGDANDRRLPPKIKKITDSKQYSHLVWLSQRAREKSNTDFVWNLSHELQHLGQDIKNRALSVAGNFLYYNLGKMQIDEPKIPTTVPTEMDAELAAWRIARNLLGRQIADSYVCDNANIGTKQEIFRDLLKYNDPNKEYPVPDKTVSLLRKYQPQFDNIIEQEYNNIGSIDELVKKIELGEKE